METTNKFAEENSVKVESSDSARKGKAEGRWTEEEHSRFLIGLKKYDKNWKKLESFVGSRTSSQIRSHAQKAIILVLTATDRLFNRCYYFEKEGDSSSGKRKITNIFNEGQSRLFEINRMINSDRLVRDSSQHGSSTLQRQRENKILKSSGSMLYKLDKLNEVKVEVMEDSSEPLFETENLNVKEESESKCEMFDNSMLHFSGDSSAFQVNKRKPNYQSDELRPIDIMGEEAFDNLISKCDAYMKEEIQEVSNHIYSVIADYKKNHPVDILEEPVFKFCVKVLHLKIDDQIKPPKNRVEILPLNNVAQSLSENQTDIKQEAKENN